jgi:predicted transcriptional regulator
MALSVKSPRQSSPAPKERTYKATKAELAAIRKGEAAFARGEFLNLAEFLDEMDRNRRRAGAKTSSKVSR